MRNATKLTKVRWLVVYSTDLVYLLGGLGLIQLHAVWQAGFPGWLAALGAALLTAVIVMGMRVFRTAVADRPRPTALIVVSGVLTLPLMVVPVIWAIPVWLSMLALFVQRRTVVLLSLASVVLIGGFVTVVAGFEPVVLASQATITVILVGGVRANLALWRVTREAHEGEEARARLAVSEERLRFARDLNDLLGQSLTGIAARTAQAERTLQADPREAAREMFEVRDQARRALREVRATVQNYRALDLDEVLASVRAVLEAADVRCTVRADGTALPPETRTLLATVVREGATNVLKHSKAEHCTITIREGVLEMSNDGVSGPTGEHAANGLAGLAQRVRGAGGTLSAAPAGDGTYTLRVEVPA